MKLPHKFVYKLSKKQGFMVISAKDCTKICLIVKERLSGRRKEKMIKQKGRPSGLPFLTKLTNLTKPKLMKKNVLQRYVV
jgi:hypothetical protein